MISPSEESCHRRGECSVPWHWRVTRLKFVADILSGATPSSDRAEYWGGDIAWVTPDDLGRQRGRIVVETNRGITEEGYESCATTLVPAGSVALSIRAPIGHIGIIGMPACVNQGCRLLVPRTAIDGKFLYWVLWGSRSQLQQLGRGTTFMEVSRVDLADLPVALPPVAEQKSIVHFLDHADRHIRRYIRVKERLIELLEEQKQATIHQAVTGQINVRTGQPYPAYKDSGMEWLEEVPEHWETRPSKRTFTPRKELARSDDIQLSATQAYGVIAQKDYEERVGRKIVKIFKHLKKRRHVRSTTS